MEEGDTGDFCTEGQEGRCHSAFIIPSPRCPPPRGEAEQDERPPSPSFANCCSHVCVHSGHRLRIRFDFTAPGLLGKLAEPRCLETAGNKER